MKTTSKDTNIKSVACERQTRNTIARFLVWPALSLLVLARICSGADAPAVNSTAGLQQTPPPLTLQVEPGEKWWGGAVVAASSMPYGAKSYVLNLTDNILDNQATPLLISQHGRYVWCDEPFKFQFKDGMLIVTPHSAPIQSGQAGTTLKEAYQYVSKTYFPPTGTTPNELMFLAPQYNTWIELKYNQNEADVLKYAHSIIDNGFPPGVLMIDDNWQEDYGVWEFSARRFPHPKAMMDELHRMGFKVMVWMVPFVSPDSAVYRDLAKKGLFLGERGREWPAIVHWWNGASALLDLSNPEAAQWFKGRLQYLVDTYGVDGFKFDGGDPEFYAGDVTSREPVSANAQSELYARLGLAFPLNEYRACWKMGGQPLAQRLRDKRHEWKDLQLLIPGILAQGLMGYAYTCPDMIGGGEISSFDNLQNVDQDLVVRAAQCHALMPMMQFSVAPWRVLDAQHLALCKAAAILHKDMGPEILALAKQSSQTGEPIIRSMEYSFPGHGWEEINDQFMLGDDVLVAPVMQKGATNRMVQFPGGKWKGNDGSLVDGPCHIQVNAPLERLPWYRRVN